MRYPSRHSRSAAATAAASIGERPPSGRAARERRAKARASLSRAERREEAFGQVFDFLSAPDVFGALLGLGAAEVQGAAALGGIVFPTPLSKAGATVGFGLAAMVLAAGQICVGMALWSLLKFLSILNTRMRRPIYYPKERLRRQRLARERRRVRDRFTLSPCPAPEDLVAQYAKARRDAREAIRFGSMLCDLEAYCDNSLVRNVDGEIIGRNPGVKGWLRTNCPELLKHYKNAMRYKGIAEKLRQAVGAADPVPAVMLASSDEESVRRIFGKGKSRKITVRMQKANGDRRGETTSERFTLEVDAVVAAWQRAQEILAVGAGDMTTESTGDRPRRGIPTQQAHGSIETGGEGALEKNARPRCGSVAALVAALDERLAPEFAPSGWRFANVAPPRGYLLSTGGMSRGRGTSVAPPRGNLGLAGGGTRVAPPRGNLGLAGGMARGGSASA